MAVHRYGPDNPHPSGFIGLRVNRCVGGTPRQRYFATSGKTEAEIAALAAEAERLDADWHREAVRIRTRRARDAVPTARCQTSPVRGIRAVVLVETKRRATTRTYRTRAWEVSVAEHNPIRFRIREHGDRRAFERAVRCLCRIKDWDGLTARRLIARWRPHASYQDHAEVA